MTPITPGFSNNLAATWARPAMPRVGGSPGSPPDGGLSGVAAPKSDARFGDVLTDMIRRTDESQKVSSQTTGALLSGQNVPVHQVMVASEEASVSFQLMLEVRNRLLDGYQELMRMQV